VGEDTDVCFLKFRKRKKEKGDEQILMDQMVKSDLKGSSWTEALVKDKMGGRDGRIKRKGGSREAFTPGEKNAKRSKKKSKKDYWPIDRRRGSDADGSKREGYLRGED